MQRMVRKKNSTKLNVPCTKLLWWKLIFELEGGINFSEEEGLRAHMRFSLATTSVGEGKKSDQHSKNRDPLKENKVGKRKKKRLRIQP